MKKVDSSRIVRKFRYFIRSIIPMFVLLLSFMVVGCGATPAATNKSATLSAKTFYNDNTTCDLTLKEVKYDITFPLTAGKTDINSGTICVKTDDNNTSNVQLKTGYAVQVLVSTNHEILKDCKDQTSEDNVYVTISRFKGTIGKSQLNLPFHTNRICSGDDNGGGDNTDGDGDGDDGGVTLPIEGSDFEVTVTKIPYGEKVADNEMPQIRLTSYLGLRSSITTIGNEIHFLYGSESAEMNTGNLDDRRTFARLHYSYNVITNKWTDINKLDIVKNQEKTDGRRDPTVDAAITSHGEKVYIYGGRYAGDLNADKGHTKKALTAYDTKAKKWAIVVGENNAADDMPSNASDLATVGDKIYRFGGTVARDDVSKNTIHVLDTTAATPTWTAVTINGLFTPSARMYHRSVVIGKKIYYYGGVTHYTKNVGVTDPFVVFDTSNNTWQNLTPTDTATLPSKVRSRFSLLALDSNTLFISSGAASGEVDSELNSYIYEIDSENVYQLPGIDMIKSFTAEKTTSVKTDTYPAKYQRSISYDYVTAYYTVANGKIYLLRVQPVDGSHNASPTPKEIEVYTIEIKKKTPVTP